MHIYIVLINIVSRVFLFNLFFLRNRILSMFKVTKSQLISEKDTIRIKNGKISCSLNIYSGKQRDYIINYCPSLNISGYGKTDEEAEDFIKVEMEVFCEDLHSMNTKNKEDFLSSLGFKRDVFAAKNYSRAFVDENGKLQDFEEGTLQHKMLESA